MPLYHTRLQPLFHLSVHSWNVVNHNLKFEHLTQKNRLLGGFSEKGGPSDRIRTCGILLPKQARYQLRYTRLLSYFIRLVVFSQTRRDTNFAIPGYSISAIIPRRGRKSKIFLSVVIYVVKGDFVPLSAIGENPANAGVARLCGVSPHPIPDTTTALPKQARYQLRYTRLYIVGLSDRPHSIPYSAPVFKSFLHRQPQKV